MKIKKIKGEKMKENIFSVVFVALIGAMMMATSSFAADGLQADGSIYVAGNVRFSLPAEKALNDIAPSMSILDYAPVKAGDGYILSADCVADAVAKDAAVKAAAASMVRECVHDGMDEDAALTAIGTYLHAKFPYADGQITDYQSAYQQIQTGKGVCASQSRLLREMAKLVPMKDGVVNFAEGRTGIIKVHLCTSVSHMWDVAFRNGVTYIYDAVLNTYGHPSSEFDGMEVYEIRTILE